MRDSKTGMAIMLVASVISGSITVFAIIVGYISIKSLDKILAFAVALSGIGVTILVVEMWRQKNKMKNVNKGKKLAEIRYKPIKSYTNGFRYLTYILTFAIILMLFAGVSMLIHYGKASPLQIYPIPLLIFYYFVFFKERKIDIYDKGIKHGITFHEWKDVALDGNKLVFKNNSTIKIPLDDEALTIVESLTRG